MSAKLKNSLCDLNNYLFEALDRLNDDDLKGEDLDRELKRSKGITEIAGQIIDNGKLVLESMKYTADYGPDMAKPAMLEVDK